MSAITAKASRKMKKYAVLTREPRCFLGSFDFSWEQRKLGDIADIVGGGTPSTGNQSYWDGDIDWYAPAEIADQIYANSSQKKITGLGYENSSAKMLPPGTVLFTSRAGIGKTAILTRKGCTNQGFQSIVPHRGELDSYFIFSRTEELKRYGELVGAGSTFVEVSGKQMAVMELMMPPTMREQQTIGGFFQQLDHLITLHQRKCALLFSPFQAFISMMFTTSTFSWEQRKVSELFRVTRGYVLAATQTETTKTDEKPYPVYSSQTKDKGLMGYYKDYLYEDAITWTTDGANAGTVNYRAGKFYCTNVCGVLLSNEVKANQMIAEALNSVAKGYVSYVGNPKLMNNVMADIVIQIPTQAEEREQLSSFFAKLDNLITLHQRKCIFFTGRAGRLISTVNKKRITSSWEQRKLSELTSMHARIGWQNLRTSEFLDSGDYMLITGTDFNDGTINFSTCHYVERERYEQDRNIQIHNGSILITKDGTLGKVAYVQGLSLPATLNAGVFNVQIKDANSVDEKYLFQYLKAPFLMDYVDKKATGGTIKHLNQNILVDFPVILPQRSEQILIGAFFQQLDNLITLHQRKPFLMKWRTSDANRNQTNRLVL